MIFSRTLDRAFRLAVVAVVFLFVAAPVLSFVSDADARPGGGGTYKSSGSRSSGSSGSTSRSSGSSGSSSRSSGSSFGSGSSSRPSSSPSSSDSPSSAAAGAAAGAYYGSGGGYGSSSSSGSSDSDLFDLFAGIGLVVLVAAIILVIKWKMGDTLRKRSAMLDAQDEVRWNASIEALQVRDPQLTVESIILRVQNMSVILREAWCSGNMLAARPFVSDGVYSRFQVQLGLMRAEGVRNVMSDAKVLFTTIEGVDSRPPIDVVHVRFTAEARDCNVPHDATPEQIAKALNKASVEPYTEIWTLVRKQGAVTRLPPDQIGKACPNCGAPLDPQAEMIRCKYCRALVCSAEHDWVLSEITQLSEWYPESSNEVSGLTSLREVDPLVAREVLEDRASYLFWKWIQAARQRHPGPIRKCATPEFIQQRANVGPLAQVSDVAIGAADCILCDPGPEGGFDHVYVKIYWSARGQPNQEPTPSQTVARLVRRAGMRSDFSMTSVVCPTCGAALTETDTTQCDYCRTELAAGAQAWVLDAMLPPGEVRPRARATEAEVPEWLVPNIADPRERSILFAQMASLMSQDGTISKQEQKLLRVCGQRWVIPEETISQVMANPRAASTMPLVSSSPQWFLAGLVAAALVDGNIDNQERAMLERARTALSLPPEEVERQIQAFQQRLGVGPHP